MMDIQRIPVLVPIVVSTAPALCTVLIQALPLGGTIWFIRGARKLGLIGRSFWTDSAIVALITALALVAHLIEIAVWAIVFLLCGEFTDMGAAYYHSAVNFTTLGYGDILLSPHWRMLGPLEAATGMLMFGVSTAMVFTVIMRLAQTKFADLRE